MSSNHTPYNLQQTGLWDWAIFYEDDELVSVSNRALGNTIVNLMNGAFNMGYARREIEIGMINEET